MESICIFNPGFNNQALGLNLCRKYELTKQSYQSLHLFTQFRSNLEKSFAFMSMAFYNFLALGEICQG
jgi:hypothetical protein